MYFYIMQIVYTDDRIERKKIIADSMHEARTKAARYGEREDVRSVEVWKN